MEGKREGEMRGKMNSCTFLYYVNIYKCKSFEFNDTTMESKVKLCKKLLNKQQRLSLSYKITHWTLWNQTVED